MTEPACPAARPRRSWSQGRERPGAPLNATVLAVAERAAELITGSPAGGW